MGKITVQGIEKKSVMVEIDMLTTVRDICQGILARHHLGPLHYIKEGKIWYSESDPRGCDELVGDASEEQERVLNIVNTFLKLAEKNL